MKKVFLMYAPSPQMNRTARCQQPIKELVVLPPLPPTDLMYCAAVAERAGAVCKIKDYSVEGGDINTVKNDIKCFNPDIVFVNAATTTLEKDIAAIKAVKEVNPDIITVASGAHFLIYNTSILEEHPCIDILLRGEPELTFEEIVAGKPYEEIKGITYRKDGLPFNNEDRPFNDNLDILPHPARHLVKNELYVRPDNGKKQAVIRVASGCPYGCFFCLATPVSGAKVRFRSADDIISEITECKIKYGIRDFVFWSDLFTGNRGFVEELCGKLIGSKLNITWGANSRVDTIDEDLLTTMYRAGCRLISFGIESGSDEILEKIGKKFKTEQARKAIKICKKARMKTFAYYVIGLPWEDEKHIEETIKFSLELNTDYVNYYTATVFPGTKFFNYVREHAPDDLNAEDLYINPYYYPCVKTDYLSKDRIKELHKSAVKRFYLRPSYILKKLTEIKSLKELSLYFKAGLSVVFKR